MLIGFYTSYSEEPLASSETIIPVTSRKDTVALLFSAYQLGTPIWLRFLIPFKGDRELSLLGKLLAVNCYFTLHYQEGASGHTLRLTPPESMEETAFITFSSEENSILGTLPKPSSDELLENMYEQITLSKQLGQYYRALIYHLYVSVTTRDATGTAKYLGIRSTAALLVIEAADYADAFLDLSTVPINHPNKHNEEFFKYAYRQFRVYCEKVTLIERNAVLESLQPPIITTLIDIEEIMDTADEQKYVQINQKMKWVRSILKIQELISVLTVHHALNE